MSATEGFPPIIGPRPRMLILGSLPSQRSIQTGQYYANPQNAFWKIMGDLFGAGPDKPYRKRTEALVSRQIAVWDVLASSERPGSMDSNIVRETAKANDFDALLVREPDIKLICFNGQVAAKFFQKLVTPSIRKTNSGVNFVTLPSSSPAYAAMNYADKLKSWSRALVPTTVE